MSSESLILAANSTRKWSGFTECAIFISWPQFSISKRWHSRVMKLDELGTFDYWFCLCCVCCVSSFSLIRTLLCGSGLDRITWHVRDGRGDVCLLWNTPGDVKTSWGLGGQSLHHFDCQVMMMYWWYVFMEGLMCKPLTVAGMIASECEWFHVNLFLNFHGAWSLCDPLWDTRVWNHI